MGLLCMLRMGAALGPAHASKPHLQPMFSMLPLEKTSKSPTWHFVPSTPNPPCIALSATRRSALFSILLKPLAAAGDLRPCPLDTVAAPGRDSLLDASLRRWLQASCPSRFLLHSKTLLPAGDGNGRLPAVSVRFPDRSLNLLNVNANFCCNGRHVDPWLIWGPLSIKSLSFPLVLSRSNSNYAELSAKCGAERARA